MKLARRAGACTPRPTCSLQHPNRLPPTSFLPCSTQIRGKAMADKAGDMLDIARDILLTARLDDRERFKQVGMMEGDMLRRRLARVDGCCHPQPGTHTDRLMKWLFQAEVAGQESSPSRYLHVCLTGRLFLPAHFATFTDGAGDEEQPGGGHCGRGAQLCGQPPGRAAQHGGLGQRADG